jgi:molybdopterin-containing oxidoreductase family iron-sulfur binding subunit
MNKEPVKLDLASIRKRLEAATGKQYWRSLEELAETEGFEYFLQREFPRLASEWDDGPGRRKFLKLMGASLALAGLSACTKQPTELIMPYVRAPEEVVPGKPLFFATAMPAPGGASPVLVESHLGRPTKVEGNPEHPASLGAAGIYAQASILGLYDPDRSQTLTFEGEIRAWPSFLTALKSELSTQKTKNGAGLRLLTESSFSPAFGSQMQALLKEYPGAKWHVWEPADLQGVRAGAQLAFGSPVNTYYRFDQAELIVSLDADILGNGPASVRYARDFAERRRVRHGHAVMSRLYAVESSPTLTGAKADNRLTMRAAEIEGFAFALAARLGVAGVTANPPEGPQAKWIDVLAKELQAHKGTSAVVPGEYQTPAVHALAHAINAALGNSGRTVVHTDPLEQNPVNPIDSLRELIADIDAGAVDLLAIIDANPVYSAPADLGFRERLLKVPLRMHLGLYHDETGRLCHWHIPKAHYLEAWSDVRAYDGTVSIVQPLIAPLYRGRSPHEFLTAFTERPDTSGYDLVREYWGANRGSLGGGAVKPQPAPGAASANPASARSAAPLPTAATTPPGAASANPASAAPVAGQPAGDFEIWWRRAVHDGFIANSALPARNVTASTAWLSGYQAPQPASGLEIVFRPDPYLYDGRFANNGWLQETPRPLTRITWDNAAHVSPKTAERLRLQNEDVLELRYQGRSLRLPAWIMPGHPDESLTVHLGWGRERAGRVGNQAGFNVNAIRTSNAPWHASGLEVRKTGARYPLAVTQGHHLMENRHLVRAATLEQYKNDPHFAHKVAHEPPKGLTLYPEWKYEGYAWGMTIDQTACVGCNACVVACQAENNIPVVGKEQVIAGREMHWLRIDRYYEGPLEDPETYFQPVLCMHCETAPCEVVCPVNATTHSSEGLNDMTYNRCVGTRYCSHNCPYKVRRFNFFLYSDWDNPSVALQKNPDVTVRSRGVMEKCSYCVQRINHARIEAEKENRAIRDGEILTACQATCPAQAIVFGNINDPNSQVARLKKEDLNYGLLTDLNTRPRTTYLASLSNPHPELEA